MGKQKKIGEITVRSRETGQYRSGDIAEFSGIYQLHHREHPIHGDVFVMKGTTLPFCPICGNAIDCHLVEKVDHIYDDPDFQSSEPG